MAMNPTTCNGCEDEVEWETFCIICEELYCNKCSRLHRRQKATRKHDLVDTTCKDNDYSKGDIEHPCNGCDESKSTNSLCLDCKELFCNECRTRHLSQKATRGHEIIAIKLLESEDLVSIQDTTSTGRSSMAGHQRSTTTAAQVLVERGPYNGVFTHEFMSSARGDKEVTRVRGIVILSDGRIIIADYKNRSLKLYNKDFNFVSARDLKDDPRGMTLASPGDLIVVTFADKKEIRIYKIDSNKIRSHKQFKMKEKPYSIAFSKNHLAVETGEGEDGSIFIVDITGKERAVIPGFTRTFGQFTGNTIRLALDYSKELVFVADVVKDCIHCLHFNGTLQWSVHVPSPRGLALHGDTLFIASSLSNKIYQMNASNGMLYELLDEDNRIKRPRYIAFQPSINKLAVEIDGNHIKIYSIKTLSKHDL